MDEKPHNAIGKVEQASIIIGKNDDLEAVLRRAGLLAFPTMDSARANGRSYLDEHQLPDGHFVLANISVLYVEPIQREPAPSAKTSSFDQNDEFYRQAVTEAQDRYRGCSREALLVEQKELREQHAIQGPTHTIVARLEVILDLLKEPEPETTREAAEMEVHPA